MTLIALMLTASAETGPVFHAYSELLASGCDLSQVQVWSTIEARVLRNTPYAMRGHVFKSPELTALYTADGNWYAPTGPVTLDGDDAACVAKLAAREAELKTLFVAPTAFEKRLTADVQVFDGLHRWSQLTDQMNPYASMTVHQSSDGTWHFTATYPGCVDDAESGLECGGYFIQCPAEGECVVGEAG